MTDTTDNTIAAPLRINSSARLAIILAALIFFAAIVVYLMFEGTSTNGLHATLLSGALWILATIVGLMEAPTALDAARSMFLVKP